MPDDPEALKVAEEGVRAMSPDGSSILPPPAVTFGIPESHAEKLQWVNESLTPHPLKTWLDTVSISNADAQQLKKTFLHCVNPELESNISAVAARIKNDSQWSFIEMDTGHDAMITEPLLLASLLESTITS